MASIDEQEVTLPLSDIARMFKKRWLFIFGTSIILSVVYFVFSLTSPKQYESYALVRIGTNGVASLESIPALKEIMASAPMRSKITERAGMKSSAEIGDIGYDDASGLLKVTARSASPEKAMQIVQASIDIIIQRHNELHDDSQKNLEQAVKFVKEAIRPVPLSSGLSEFRSSLTTILIPPIYDNKPVKPKGRLRTSTLFVMLFLFTTIISFYIEGRKNKKS
jgi:hypothetical protein